MLVSYPNGYLLQFEKPQAGSYKTQLALTPAPKQIEEVSNTAIYKVSSLTPHANYTTKNTTSFIILVCNLQIF